MLEALAISQAALLLSSQPHTLPTRPHFDWLPSKELLQLLPELTEDLISHQLSDDQKKSLINNYPVIQGIRFTAPQAILTAASSQFNRAQSREDSTLRHLQYQLSVVFCPFDILANELLQILPQDQLVCFFIILRDTRTLLIHANSSINQARNHLALRAINPSFSVTNNNSTYTMATDTFQTTASQQASAQHALRDARPRFRRSLTNNSTPMTSARPINQQIQQQPQQHQSQQQQSSIVGGCLSLFSAAWAHLSRSPWVHSIIKYGFKIHFD
ncbi:hypothetical protein INT45_007183 [Circinella minor]|uniref:Uncharacterized protein n=1 Tax=Circinella minor TaxID=1195481 RepID=A0A8H7S5W9_9FUNG|nr:hypothetical protein INT45_007183 [Circinella minor]